MIRINRYNKNFFYTGLKKMLEIRYFESKVSELYLKGLISGTIHLYSGQEAIAVGTCLNLNNNDIVFSNHRPHGHAIAKGVSKTKIFSEILGRSNGCCGGKGGSMHIADFDLGFAPAIAIVGAGIPIAAGAAFAFKYKGLRNVAISFFGDGATNEGAFHEGLNIAAVWKLPVIFICENNLYGVSTRISSTTLLDKLSKKAESYGMEGITIDGNDFIEVFEAVKSAINKARKGRGPTLIECLTYRHWGHSRGDPAKYRPHDEVKAWLARDPILQLKKKMISQKMLSEEQYSKIKLKIIEEIEQCEEVALSSPTPDPEEVFNNVLIT